MWRKCLGVVLLEFLSSQEQLSKKGCKRQVINSCFKVSLHGIQWKTKGVKGNKRQKEIYRHVDKSIHSRTKLYVHKIEISSSSLYNKSVFKFIVKQILLCVLVMFVWNMKKNSLDHNRCLLVSICKCVFSTRLNFCSMIEWDTI